MPRRHVLRDGSSCERQLSGRVFGGARVSRGVHQRHGGGMCGRDVWCEWAWSMPSGVLGGQVRAWFAAGHGCGWAWCCLLFGYVLKCGVERWQRGIGRRLVLWCLCSLAGVCVPGTVPPLYVCVLCGMFVHAVSGSCPGPALVSTATIRALALVAGGQYAPNMDCSVTVYSPDGLGVALVFTTFFTQTNYDCTCIGGRSSRARAVAGFSVVVVGSCGSCWKHGKSTCVVGCVLCVVCCVLCVVCCVLCAVCCVVRVAMLFAVVYGGQT